MVKRRWGRKKSQPKIPSLLSRNTVKVWSQTGGVLRFTLSYDIVERLVLLRDGPKGKLNAYSWRDLHVEFMTMTHHSMPAIFMRLDEWRLPSEKSPHPKLSKRNDGHRFHTSISARRVGIRPDQPHTRLKLLWLKKLKGILLIFPDESISVKKEEPPA